MINKQASTEEKLEVFLDSYEKAKAKGMALAICGSCALYLYTRGDRNLRREFGEFRRENSKECDFSDMDIFINLNNNLPKDTEEVFGVIVYPNFDPMFGWGPPTQHGAFHLELASWMKESDVVEVDYNGKKFPLLCLEKILKFTHKSHPTKQFVEEFLLNNLQ